MFCLAILTFILLIILLFIQVVSLRLSVRIMRAGSITTGLTIALSLLSMLLSFFSLFVNYVTPLVGITDSNYYGLVILVNCMAVILVIVALKKKLDIRYLRATGLYFLWLALGILLSVPVAFAIKAYAYQAFEMPSGAMKPTILIGDHFVVKKYAYWLSMPKRNDIIIFIYPWDPKKLFIKRVVGIGGDRVEIRDKQVYVNGKAAEAGFHADSRTLPRNVSERDNFGPVETPREALFVLGDNRDQSYDSRFWGFVPMESVKAKAYFIYWSQDLKTGKIRTDRIGKWIK